MNCRPKRHDAPNVYVVEKGKPCLVVLTEVVWVAEARP
jgi:hypothetical protein